MAAPNLRTETPAPSSEAELRATFDRQRQAVLAHRYPSVAERRASLQRLLRMMVDNERAIVDAQVADFRGTNEALAYDMLPSVLVTKHAIRGVRGWMRPERRWINPVFGLWSARVDHHPLGVIGIISPWNYPLLLTVGPLVGALAAGNRAMIKLSEHSPAFADVFARLVREHFEPEQLTVTNGGPELAAAFASLPFDHLVFTGSTHVGRRVAQAAADNLTPVTLELGGKSPAIIDRGFSMPNIDTLVFGKLINSGQSCTAPDYVFVHEDDRDAFVAHFDRLVRKLWPSWASASDTSRIVDERHVARLRGYLADAEQKGAKLHETNPGGESGDALGRRLVPTLVTEVTDDMKIMQEEIFGPLLAIKTYRELGEAIDHVNARPHPLALYVYSHDQRMIDRVRLATQSGSFAVNFSTIQFGFDELPAGGVGFSGMGSYHGVDGFRRFSHQRAYARPRFNGAKLLFPPYRKFFRRVIAFLVRR